MGKRNDLRDQPRSGWEQRTDSRVDAIDERLATLEAMLAPDVDYLLDHGWTTITHPGGLSAKGQWWKAPAERAPGLTAVQHSAVEKQREWDAEADPPEFSCQPTDSTRDDWPPVLFPGAPGTTVYNRAPKLADGVKPHRTMSGVTDDVREGVRERSNLADTRAGEAEWPEPIQVGECLDTGDPITYVPYASERQLRMRLDRYERSLRALLALTEPESFLTPGHDQLSDLHSLIAGCLAGGTITPEGLRDA